MRVVVLGCGRIGSVIAATLASDESVSVAVVDRDTSALERLKAKADLEVKVTDLADRHQVARLAADCDLVVSAVPGFLGYQTLEAVLTTGTHVVDIAFFPEDPFGLDQIATEKGATAIVDIGVSPGMSGVLVAHAATGLDAVQDVAIYVGGLPAERNWPWEYKAVFSPIDVIEEYIRPARLRSEGELVTLPALSEVELVEFEDIGTLEAFNTDGLRTLLDTIPAANMVEKTLRYPGHADQMRILRESGFFSTEPVDVVGNPVRPIDLTTQLLFPMWQLEEGEADLTVMRVLVEGLQEGQPTRYVYDLMDRYDPESGVTSMARTTGYTATAAARLVLDGRYRTPGISPPEYLGKDPSITRYLLERLAERGVVYDERVERLD